MRASLVVNCQSTFVAAAFRAACQWPICWASVSTRAIRRARHWRPSAPSSISAMFSHDPCLGVWWISSLPAMRLASSGANASYSEAAECVPLWVVRAVVHLQHVLHVVHELGRLPGRDAPHLPQVRPQLVFF